MRTKRLAIFWLSLAVTLLLNTCEKPERNNPWDDKAQLDPQEWAPKSLTLSSVSITSQKLTWAYNGDDYIEGFKISRKKGNENWVDEYHITDKEAHEWTDEDITPDSTLTYTYHLCTIAGENSSSKVEVSFTPKFQAPSNLQITKVNDISYRLSWTDNSNGEEGFKIDRRVDNGEWQGTYSILDANTTSFLDTNVFSAKSAVLIEYTLSAYHGEQRSTKRYISTSAALTAPTNLMVMVNSQTSVTLNWQQTETGHQGFRIDKRVNDGNWQETFVSLPHSQKSFEDNDVNLSSDKYTYRVYTYYEQYISDKTEAYISKPTVTTGSPFSIAPTSVLLNSSVIDEGGNPVTARGVVWSTSQNPTISSNQGFTTNGSGSGGFTSNPSNLTPNTTYYVRAYATNSVGTGYGNQVSFTTEDGLPELTTTEISAITPTTATSGGNITSDGGFSITAKGVVWSTSQNPTTTSNEGSTNDGTGTATYTSSLTDLTPNVTYYVRAYATNSVGTQYGNQISFKTLAADGTTGTVTYNSYTYKTVYINGKEWMAENLRTTEYNDGTTIPLVTDNAAWAALSTPAYCWYNNDQTTYGNTYGALYNWYAVSTTTNGGKNVCPTGWHVPTDAEWYAMENYVDPTINDPNATGWRGTDGGTKLKATTGWNSGGNGTDIYGFSALPGGGRHYYDGAFFGVGDNGYWWSSTEYDAAYAWNRYMYYGYGLVDRFSYPKRDGFSVRCVRDN